MATRLSRALALIAFTLASVTALSGQEIENESGTTTGTETATQTDYWYETVEGAVVFTQSLKWDPVPYCPYYDVTIEKTGKDGAWASVHESRVETAELKVRLQPGEYRYRLVVYDVLGRVSLTSEWFPFTVIRALQPKVSSVSPGTIYFEEENSDVFSIDGSNLLETSEYYFKPADGRGKTYRLSLVDADPKGKDARVSFPIDSINVGTYELTVKNPGGLSTASDPVVFKYIKPMDLDVSIGYMPTVVLWDGTIEKYFEASFIPLGVTAKATFIPAKRALGYFGVGLFASGSRVSNETEYYDLTMNWAMAHLVFAYQRAIIKNRLMFACHIGPGYTVFYDLAFSFKNGISSPDFSPTSFSGIAGLSLHLYVRKRIYVDLSADCTMVFMKDMRVVSLHPSLSIGRQF